MSSKPQKRLFTKTGIVQTHSRGHSLLNCGTPEALLCQTTISSEADQKVKRSLPAAMHGCQSGTPSRSLVRAAAAVSVKCTLRHSPRQPARNSSNILIQARRNTASATLSCNPLHHSHQGHLRGHLWLGQGDLA